MSLVELKQEAKNHVPKIKQYYIKSRIELIKLLSMTEFPEDMIICKKTIADLRKEAQERKLPNIWKLRRAELVNLLYPSPEQYDKNNNNRQKHYHPEKCEHEQIGINMLKNS